MRTLSFLVSLLSIRLSQSENLTKPEASHHHEKECRQVCQDYFDNKLDKKLCQPTLNLMPRPGVYNACINGMITGFKQSCTKACLTSGEMNDMDLLDSFSACQSEAKKAHPNYEFTWCRKGYDDTYKNMYTIMKDMAPRKGGLPDLNSSIEDKGSSNQAVESHVLENGSSYIESFNDEHKFQKELDDSKIENQSDFVMEKLEDDIDDFNDVKNSQKSREHQLKMHDEAVNIETLLQVNEASKVERVHKNNDAIESEMITFRKRLNEKVRTLKGVDEPEQKSPKSSRSKRSFDDL